MDSPAPVIYLVDDDTSFLKATSRLLSLSGFKVKTFDSATSFLNQFLPGAPGCVIADLDMPGINGLDLQNALAKAGHATPLIFLTGHGNIESSVLAMRRGAEDFVTKQASKSTLLDAIRRALARDACLRALRKPFETLTPREREVLAHVLKGQMNKQIAGDLAIDERSVKRHRTRIMAKLGVQSVVELSHHVHEAGLTFPLSTPTPPRP